MTWSGGLDLVALDAGSSPLRDAARAWFEGWAGQGTFLGFVVLLLLYPEGRWSSEGRWAGVLLAAALLTTAVAAFAPTVSVGVDSATSVNVRNPFALMPDLPWIRFLTSAAGDIYVPAAVLALALGSTVVRYRRSRGALRLQLRWLLASIASVGAAVVLGALALAFAGDRIGSLAWVPAVAAFPSVPLAVAVAVLRYRLYDIDLVVRRTVTYGVVTTVLGAVYAGTVIVLQRGVRLLTGGRSDLAVVASTLLIAALFTPLRRWVQAGVDRRFHRSRVDTERTLRTVFAALRGEVLAERVARDMLVSSSNRWPRRMCRCGLPPRRRRRTVRR